jgi:ribonuclease D
VGVGEIDMSSRSEQAFFSLSPTVITTLPRLAMLLEELSVEPAIAVDTESNSLFAYQERVCLIQFSTPSADYLVDPLSGLDLSPLAHIFADPGIQKTFHAAEYDVMCLKRDFEFCFVNLFDTMWAARILGWPRVGLGDVLKETFNVHTSKRYQRYNWGKRPLEPEALAYACMDTHYLLDLRQLQLDALTRQGRLEEAREMFDGVAASEPAFRPFTPEDFWRIKGAHDLDPHGQAILRELCVWRDQEARRLGRPHFKVLSDRILIALAQARPHVLEELTGVDGLKSFHVHRYGRRILQAIKRGQRAELPRPPLSSSCHSDADMKRFRALRAWRKRVAARRGVDTDVIVGNEVLWALAERNPRTLDDLCHIEGLGPWRRKVYGEAILKVLADC